MAVVHVNGFGTVPVVGDYISPVVATSGISTFSRQAGRSGGYALRHTNSSASASVTRVAKLTLTPTSDFTLGVAVNHRAAWTPNADALGFRAFISPAGVGWGIHLGTGAANTYAVPGGVTAWTIVDATPSGTGWHWWCWVFRANAATGLCQLYRDGTLIAQADGDTVSSSGTGVVTSIDMFMGNDNGGAQADFADLIIRNDATVIPDSSVATLFPSATTAAGWLGSDGNSVNNEALVNENPDHNPATYVAAATAGTLDTYTLADLPSTATSVLAVQVAARATKSDTGAKTMQVLANANTGPAFDPGAAGTVYGVFETDSGSAWTTASINAMTAGIKVVS